MHETFKTVAGMTRAILHFESLQLVLLSEFEMAELFYTIFLFITTAAQCDLSHLSFFQVKFRWKLRQDISSKIFHNILRRLPCSGTLNKVKKQNVYLQVNKYRKYLLYHLLYSLKMGEINR